MDDSIINTPLVLCYEQKTVYLQPSNKAIITIMVKLIQIVLTILTIGFLTGCRASKTITFSSDKNLVYFEKQYSKAGKVLSYSDDISTEEIFQAEDIYFKRIAKDYNKSVVSAIKAYQHLQRQYVKKTIGNNVYVFINFIEFNSEQDIMTEDAPCLKIVDNAMPLDPFKKKVSWIATVINLTQKTITEWNEIKESNSFGNIFWPNYWNIY